MCEPQCGNNQRYTEDRELGVAYLDVFRCNDAAAVRTEEVAPGVLIIAANYQLSYVLGN